MLENWCLSYKTEETKIIMTISITYDYWLVPGLSKQGAG